MIEITSRTKTIVLFILLTVLILLLAGYLGMVVYFQSHYFFNTKVSNMDCSREMPEDLEKKIASQYKDYRLTINGRDKKKYYLKGTDIAYRYVSNGEEEKILGEQNPFLWPKSLFQTQEYTIVGLVAYDRNALESAIRSMALFSPENSTEPQNAYIKYMDSGYEVIPEIQGNKAILEKVLSRVADALSKRQVSLELTEECYERPTITASHDSIVSITNKIDSYVNSTITYDFGDSTEKLTSADIYSMLVIAEDGTISVDDKKIQVFVQKLATDHNTFGDERQFTTTLGDTITIGGGGYGWIVDKEKEQEAIKAHLGTGIAERREPIYSGFAKVKGRDDIGDTYVEIDYTNQRMYYYKESNLAFESDVVSGNLTIGYGSPDGVFKIEYKQTKAVLRGVDYEVPVDYFIVFAYNVGFHDANWQSVFGGDRYLTDGSHGCINMPPKKAEEFFNMIEEDIPVIAYYREPVVISNTSAKESNAYSYKAP